MDGKKLLTDLAGLTKKTSIKLKKISWKSLFWWYLGIMISLIPGFFEAIVYLADHEELDLEFWIKLSLRGDLLWVLATIMAISFIDYIISLRAKKTNFTALKKVCLIVAGILWGVTFGIWIIFKYVYPSDFGRAIPVIITAALFAVTVLVCSPLHVEEVGEK